MGKLYLNLNYIRVTFRAASPHSLLFSKTNIISLRVPHKTDII